MFRQVTAILTFLNFRHCQVPNFKISNLYEQNQNFGVIFQKYRKQKRKSTKYFETSHKPRVIPLKFCEMSNLIFFVTGDNLECFVSCKDCQAILTIVSETEEQPSSRPKDTQPPGYFFVLKNGLNTLECLSLANLCASDWSLPEWSL